MHEVTVRSTLDRPLVALGAACMKLMRIIPDNEPGYSDTLATVKRYLLDGAASAFCAVVFRALFPFSPLTLTSSRRERKSARDLPCKTPIQNYPAFTSPRCPRGRLALIESPWPGRA